MSKFIRQRPPDDATWDEVLRYLDELEGRLEAAFRRVNELEKVETEPTQTAQATDKAILYYADGTSWNPGAGGEGVYALYNGSFNKLG